MAKRVLIIGGSGTGKSTSIRTLDPKTTFIINVEGKDLPFKPQGYTFVDVSAGPPEKGNFTITNSPDTIIRILKFISEKRPDIKSVIIDDWQYVAMHEFVGKIREKGFDKFNILGKNIIDICSLPKTLREDLTIFYLTHQEKERDEMTGEIYYKAKSFGKLVDNVVGGLEGLFSIVLFTEVQRTKEGVNHLFVTQNLGNTTAKTPMTMFTELYIPNDLQLVSNTINTYYK